MDRSSDLDCDVLVVGAGLAGLTAAARLQRGNASVMTLEARGEVGGRTRSRAVAGGVVDLGGEFVGPHHRRVRDLARGLGVPLSSSGLARARTLWRIERERRVGYLPRLSTSELADVARTAGALRRLARTVPAEEPWEAPDAAALDARSFHEWLERRGVAGRAYALFAAMFEALATTRLRRLSLLQVLWWIARAGGPVAAMRDVNAMRVAGGAQALCGRLADRLQQPVRLSTPVRQVRQDADTVALESTTGGVWRARYAIVCAPLPALGAIDFVPALDEPRQALHDEVGFGRATSVVVTPRGETPGRHRLVVGGDALPLAWRADGGAKGVFLSDDPDASLVDELSKAFELEPAGVDAELVRWPDEPFIGGTYVVFEPGQLVRHGPQLRRPHGRVHFAAAERSSWPDSMEGAVESGSQVADRVATLVAT